MNFIPPMPLFGQPSKALAVLSVLTHAVRLLSDEQVGRIWCRSSKRPCATARALFRRLESKGLLATFLAMVHPELELAAPVCVWKPGDRLPHFGRVAYRLQSRWCEAPKRTVVARATCLARRQLGGLIGGRPTRPHEVAHDLGLATVYFRLLGTMPDLPSRWRHEDELWQSGAHRRGAAIPDAVLLGAPDVVVEFGGEYSAKKLEVLHAAYQSGPYQIW